MPGNAQPQDTWTRFALSVFRLNGLLMHVGEDITRPVGQTSARWQVLGRAFEPRTVADMAREMGYARQSVQRVADVLATEELVAFHHHPADRRTKLVELTPQGREVLSAIYARQVEWSQRIMTKLDSQLLTEIADVLERVEQTLRDSDLTR